MSPVDPSEHIRLIYRVINQMGIKYSDKDEAFSEGLVALTEAAQTFDPERNVPVAAWLARNIRWSLKTWRANQYWSYQIPVQAEAKESVDYRTEFNEVLKKLSSVLSPREQLILLATALGYNGVEVAKFLHLEPMAVSRRKAKIRKKLIRAFPELI